MQSAAATAKAPGSMAAEAAAAVKQAGTAQAHRRKTASKKAVSTAGATSNATKAAPESPAAASRQAAPVSGAARVATHPHAPRQKMASQPPDVAPEDNSASEQEVEFSEAAPNGVDAAPVLVEGAAAALEAEGSQPAATALQPGRRKKRNWNPVAAQPSMPGVPARLPPIRTPPKVRKLLRQPAAMSNATAQPSERPASDVEPDLAPASEPDQAVGKEPRQAQGSEPVQAAVTEEPDQATDESPMEEPDEALASQPEPEANGQVVSAAAAALGRSTGAIASVLGLQRWSRLAPKAAKQTAVLLAARARQDAPSSHGTASASAPSAAAPSSSAAGPTPSAEAPDSSAAAPKPSTPEQLLAVAPGTKHAAAAGKAPTFAAARLMNLAADGRAGSIVQGAPAAGTGTPAKKRGRPRKRAATVDDGHGDAAADMAADIGFDRPASGMTTPCPHHDPGGLSCEQHAPNLAQPIASQLFEKPLNKPWPDDLDCACPVAPCSLETHWNPLVVPC